MSYCYYPHLFDSESYLSKRGDSADEESLLSDATNYDFDFQMDIDDLAIGYRIDANLSGNLPQVLANALEEELIDIEDEETQGKIQLYVDILKKVGNATGMFGNSEVLEPYVGFITKEEVVTLIDFLENFIFQDDLIEELKGEMLALLNAAKNNNRGLIFICL